MAKCFPLKHKDPFYLVSRCQVPTPLCTRLRTGCHQESFVGGGGGVAALHDNP